MDILLGIMVIIPLTFEVTNCALPTLQEEHGNIGVVCKWTEDNFEQNFYLNKDDNDPTTVPEYKWEMKKEYSKDNFIEKQVRKQYWKRREHGS